MDQEMLSPSRSFIGMLQIRLNTVGEEPFPGEGVLNTGGLLPFALVVNV